MGEEAEYRLQQLHPEVFGSPYPRSRYRPAPPRPTSRIITIGKHKFEAWSSGEINYKSGPLLSFFHDFSTRVITRQLGSRAFLKGYPGELANPQTRTTLTQEEQCQFWLDRRSSASGVVPAGGTVTS